MQLPKAYEPAKYEDQIYQLWEKSGAFSPKSRGNKDTYSIALPPPNATGSLHLGHVVMIAVQDAIIRYQRMLGKEVLWLPGTDHAAIATENVVIKQLEEAGIADPRKKFGRQILVKKIADYVEESRATIRNQTRKMGASLDWSRERYTMEPALNRIVNEVFTNMYQDGLIYQGHRIINWDPKLQTTVSDDEVDRIEETTSFYTLQYGPFQIATARPETKFGDKYVVMHPDDKRYAKYKHGETFDAEWINGSVRATVIKDKAIDPKFGTGVMTITPWHDATDFEIAQRHDLDKEQIIGFDGRLLPVAGEFAGMNIAEARPKIVSKLNAKRLLVKTDNNYTHNIAVNNRGKGIIEPQIKKQWFVDVNKKVIKWQHRKRSLKEIMTAVITDKDINIVPSRFSKTYFNWIDNLHDWCISRQIWWGHRIPVWYKDKDIYVGTQPPKAKGWKQDEDTLDTWFSSSLWTWSTLIDPKLTKDYSLSLEDLLKKSPDFKKFHPTDLLETSYDILFFWVARMILATTYATGQIPFKNVYLHGLVRTRDGRKMSKSEPETMIDPLNIIPDYGADALRLSMVIGQTPGNDSKLYKEKIAGFRNFNNKLWNVARYVLASLPDGYQPSHPKPSSQADQWMLQRLHQAVSKVTTGLDKYRLSDSGQAIYTVLWDDFADWYIEASKVTPNYDLLVYGLQTILKLAHPLHRLLPKPFGNNCQPRRKI